MAILLTRGGDSMIPSATMVPVFHRGSVHDDSTALVVCVDATALGPPIHWIIFIVVGVIGLGPLINLLNGPSRKLGFHSLGLVVWILVLWKSFWKTVFLG